MKQVSYQVLKATLSEVLDRVSEGESFVVTRRGKPSALVGLVDPGIRVGSAFGKVAKIRPLSFAKPTRALEILLDDREER
jgi:antitoxin (DNA-binding transcriptional repressor) of toxin-antitoxin stability system